MLRLLIMTGMLLLLCSIGCQDPDEFVGLDLHQAKLEAAQDEARRYTASSFAIVAGDQSSPTPPGPLPPEPQPGETCQRCNGTGRIKPDGRIEVDCFDCDGDGVLSVGDALAAVDRRLNEELTALNQRMESETKSLPQQAAQVPENKTQSLQWHTDLARARNESRRTGKPALVHFYLSEGCPKCVEQEREVFADPRVQLALADFVLVKIDALTAPSETLRNWSASLFPYNVVMPADWDAHHPMAPHFEPDPFLDELMDAKGWASTKRRTKELAQVRSAELTSQAQVTNVQGSFGGIAGLVMGYGGAYSGGYGSAGGYATGSAGGYGSSGGYGGITYYGQPAYRQPRAYYRPPPTYYAPSYGWGGYSGGGSIVCGPNGCYMQ